MNFGNDTVTTDMTFENVPSGMKVLSGTVQTLSGNAENVYIIKTKCLI